MSQNQINTAVLGIAPTLSSAISMQVSAHSTGIMYEQSAMNQYKSSMIALSNSVVGVKKNFQQIRNELNILKKSRFNF